ncbi:MAG TPA: hypothetical protein VIH59_01215 [Candidatus Tectomicrobia bacterium]
MARILLIDDDAQIRRVFRHMLNWRATKSRTPAMAARGCNAIRRCCPTW